VARKVDRMYWVCGSQRTGTTQWLMGFVREVHVGFSFGREYEE
jgi:hypothetical protein